MECHYQANGRYSTEIMFPINDPRALGFSDKTFNAVHVGETHDYAMGKITKLFSSSLFGILRGLGRAVIMQSRQIAMGWILRPMGSHPI